MVSKDILGKIMSHITSFKGRKSQYRRTKTRKMYLPDDLNIKKIYKIYFEQKNPHVSQVLQSKLHDTENEIKRVLNER